MKIFQIIPVMAVAVLLNSAPPVPSVNVKPLVQFRLLSPGAYTLKEITNGFKEKIRVAVNVPNSTIIYVQQTNINAGGTVRVISILRYSISMPNTIEARDSRNICMRSGYQNVKAGIASCDKQVRVII
jgi:hypothetical protein